MTIKMISMISVLSLILPLFSPQDGDGQIRFNLGTQKSKDNPNDDEWMTRTRDLISRLSNSSGKDWCTLAKELDWRNRSKKYQAVHKSQAASGIGAGNIQGEIDQDKKRISESLDRRGRDVNDLIEKAYKAKGEEARTLAQEAVEICNAMLLFYDEGKAHKDVLAYLKEAEKIAGTSAQKVAGAYKSDVSKQYAGKIVFSKKPINPLNPDPQAFTTTFKTGDNIYAVAFLKGTVADYEKPDDNFSFAIQIDGERAILQAAPGQEHLYNGLPLSDKSKANDTYVVLDLLPDLANLKKARDPNAVASIISQIERLSARTHKIHFNFATTKTFLAEGDLEIDCSPGVDKYKAIYEEARKAVTGKVSFPAPQMRDANAEAQIKKMHGATKVSIADTEWNIYRADNGAIAGRSLTAYFAYKGKDGNCYVNYGVFTQQYLGKGKYSSVVNQDSYGLTNERIDCSKVK